MCSLILHVFPLSCHYLVVSDLDVWSPDGGGDELGLYQWYRVGGHSQWSRRREPLFGLKKKTVSLWLYNHKENPPVQGECVWGESQLNHESSALISNRIRVEERGYSFKPFSQ